MIVINNECQEKTQYHFEHNNIEMAFAEIIANKRHCLAILMIDADYFIDMHVKGKIVISDKGYELDGFAIPFDSIKSKVQLH